jgi:hypothetical protein
MAIYQNAPLNKILLNAYGVVIDSSLILCYDAGNPYSLPNVKINSNNGVTDLSPASNNGTYYSYESANSGYGGIFTAGNGFLTASTSAITASFNTNPLSISIWFNQSSNYSTDNPLPYESYIVSNADTASQDRGLILATNRQLSVAVGTAVTTTTASIVPDEWYHATLVYSTTNVQLYINSILRWSKGSAAAASTGSIVGFGYNYTLGQVSTTNLLGYVALPMVYNKVLSQAEINQNYTSQAARFGLTNQTLPPLKISFDPGTIASYDPNGATPTKIYDLSGNNYTGSLSASSATHVSPAYSSTGGGSLFFSGSASITAGTSGSYIGGFVSGSSAQGSIDIGSIYTVDMWLNPTTIVNSIWMTSGPVNMYHHWINGGDNTNRTTSTANPTFQANLVANTWYNLVTVRNGDAMWSYLNGIQLTPAYTTGNNTANFNMLKIGGYLANSGYYVRGYMGAFKIYAGTLTGVQVYNNFQSTRARYGV